MAREPFRRILYAAARTLGIPVQRSLFSHGEELLESGYDRMFNALAPLSLSKTEISALATQLVAGQAAAENPDVPAGYTYFGQFVAHDLSRMRNAPGFPNLRNPTLNLDTVYGPPGALWQDQLFVKNEAGDDIFKLGRGASPTTGADTKEPDLVRVGGKAVIPDSRNDIHIIISQLHLTVMRLHNKLTEKLRRDKPGASNEEILRTVRQQISWHYQWVVVNDFLRRLSNSEVFSAVWPTNNTLHASFMPAPASAPLKIPYEFVLAAYRFGHSMVRPAYQLNYRLASDNQIFRPGIALWNKDLRGERKLPPKWSVQWDRFFQVPNSTPQKARCIGPSLTSSLRDLPDFVIAKDRDRIRNLAQRTLQIGQDRNLPSGQSVAEELARIVFPDFGIAAGQVLRPGQHDPLWYYILNEAEAVHGGRRLGPVGSWIVTSTIARVLLNDPTSFLHQAHWQPNFPKAGTDYELVDLVRYAGMPITALEWDAYVEGNAPTGDPV